MRFVSGNFYLHDVNLAIDWLLNATNAEKFGIDTERITLAGQSCGGPLASWTSVLPTLEGKIHRLYSISGNLASVYSGKNKFGKNSNFDTARELASMTHCLYPDSEDMVNCIKNKPTNLMERTENKALITFVRKKTKYEDQ